MKIMKTQNNNITSPNLAQGNQFRPASYKTLTQCLFRTDILIDIHIKTISTVAYNTYFFTIF